LLAQDSDVVDTSATEPESPEKRRVTRWQKAQKVVSYSNLLMQHSQTNRLRKKHAAQLPVAEHSKTDNDEDL